MSVTILRETVSQETAYQRLIELSAAGPVVALLDDTFWLWCRKDLLMAVPVVWASDAVETFGQQQHFPDPAAAQLLPLRLSRSLTARSLGFAPTAVIVLPEDAKPATVEQAIARFNRIDTQTREIYVWTLGVQHA